MSTPGEPDAVREQVRARYAQAATAVTDGSTATCTDACKGEDECGTGSELYTAAEQGGVPDDAVAASLGCDDPPEPPLRFAPRCGNSPTHRPLAGPEARTR